MKTEPLTATIGERTMLTLVSDAQARRAAPPTALSPALREKLGKVPVGKLVKKAREAQLQAQLAAHLSPRSMEPDRSLVDKPAPKPEPEPEPVAAKKVGQKAHLTPERRAKMVERAVAGEPVSALAKEYGVTESNLYQLRKNAKAKAKAKAKASNGTPDRTPRGMKDLGMTALAKRYAELEAELEKVKRAMRKALGAS